MQTLSLISLLKSNAGHFSPVVPFSPARDKLLPFDFTAANYELTTEVLQDTKLFTEYINRQLGNAGARYGIGGYAEHRTVYSRSKIFGVAEVSSTGRDLEGAEP